MMRLRPFPKLATFWLAIAVVAAAVADPIVEFASNAGWFGHGLFTDHSNADVLPALAAGAVVFALFIVRKARAILNGYVVPASCWRLLPAIFAVQLLVLFAMETTEQIVLRGGVLGWSVWLGGPIVASLSIHAATCIAFTWIFMRSARRLAKTTLQVLRIMRRIPAFDASAGIVVRLRLNGCPPCHDRPLLCRIGERAPPLMLAYNS